MVDLKIGQVMNLSLNPSERVLASDETTGCGKVVGPGEYEPSILRPRNRSIGPTVCVPV